MKTIVRLSLLVAMVGVIALAVGIFDGRAFHKNVDAGCNACHTMHASQDGELSPPTPQKHLIAVEGEGCLACHEFDDQAPDVYGSSPELPGGDYEYSVNDYTTGHNPIGGGDPVLGLTPPGGTTLENWSCNSCHDTYGGFEYRLLRKDPGHLGNDLDGVIIATNEDESEIWDGSANVDQSSSNHNVYRTDIIGDKEVGFGRWCAACHPYFHGGDRSDPEVGDGSDWIRHPTATSLSSDIINVYGSDYDYLYPLETMNGSASTTGNWIPSEGEDGITCLTCHKAHASEYPDALRWYYDPEQPLEPDVGCQKCHVEPE